MNWFFSYGSLKPKTKAWSGMCEQLIKAASSWLINIMNYVQMLYIRTSCNLVTDYVSENLL